MFWYGFIFLLLSGFISVCFCEMFWCWRGPLFIGSLVCYCYIYGLRDLWGDHVHVPSSFDRKRSHVITCCSRSSKFKGPYSSLSYYYLLLNHFVPFTLPRDRRMAQFYILISLRSILVLNHKVKSSASPKKKCIMCECVHNIGLFLLHIGMYIYNMTNNKCQLSGQGAEM